MTHLRKMMLEELERRNYAQTTIDCYLRAVAEFSLSPLSDPVRTGTHPPVSSSVIRPTKVSTEHCDATPRRFAILLHQDAEETMEHCRHSVSQESTTSADHPEHGRSCSTH